ncbi:MULTISPECIES: trypsin-like serine protease [unclassified Streptomyces]|uniref:trypsin-like serine protease n=1 Tax=unclassified Streptomyces TaxID=2593676 RepID=UPI001BE62209|nr:MULTISPECIES: trypsin-like serine protease [unclassified Streptomyces]MBT2403103.1 S1 family peptidase [Streptomyces sp. ISL-21]MBT2457594.1 S1 family peptidase [Streptomyces sp. ISL-86]MBT2610220.1 S1 family peptidase [Streptomyces sp. ISL-87]
MLALRLRPARTTGLLVAATAVAAGLISAAPALAIAGPEAPADTYKSVVKLTIGDEANSRGCTATLVDANWIITAASCFAATPGTSVPAGKPALKSIATLSDGKAVEVVDLVPRTDRDLVLARLATAATGLPWTRFAPAVPAAGTDLTAAGFGRTKTEWVPDKVHTGTFTTNASDTGTVTITGKGTDAICKGDTGGPLLNAAGQLVGVNSRSWQGGCLATPATETRTGAIAARADNLSAWSAEVRSLTAGWKTEAVVQAGTSLYQGIRMDDGAWTGFTDVQTKAGNIGGIRTATVAGINGDTHVVALGTNGRIYHTIRKADGTWGTFGDVFGEAGALTNVTQVSAVSTGTEIQVIAVSNGKVFHTVRRANGTWAPFGDVAAVSSPISGVTSIATANTGGELQVIAVTGGKAYHTLRTTAGHWAVWGDVAQAAGATGPISSVAMAGMGSTAHIVLATDNGTRQYHAVRLGTGGWSTFKELTAHLGNITVKSVGAAGVDHDVEIAFTTSDNRVVHTSRNTAGAIFTNPVTVPTIQGIAATPLGSIALAGTL